MGWISDVTDNGVFRRGAGLVGGVGGGMNKLFAPDRSDNDYTDMNRSNYDLPGYADRDARLGQLEQQWGQRQAPQAQTPGIGGFQDSGASSFRGDQQALFDQLRARATGQDSLSQMQLRDNLGANIRQQQAMAASARPGQGALAARSAAQQMGQMGAGLSGQQAMAGIQERQGAQNLLGGMLGQARGQDISQGQFNASQQNQRQMALAQMLAQNQQFNAGARQAQMGMNQAGQLGAMGQQFQNAAGQQQGGQAYEAARNARWGAMLGQPTRGEQYTNTFKDVGKMWMGMG